MPSIKAHKGLKGRRRRHPRHGGGGRSLSAPPPNHPGESHQGSMGSKVPVGSQSPRGSVHTATALPDRRNASAGSCPIRPQVGLAPHKRHGHVTGGNQRGTLHWERYGVRLKARSSLPVISPRIQTRDKRQASFDACPQSDDARRDDELPSRYTMSAMPVCLFGYVVGVAQS